jgi:Domain of unknown function (DUF4168)
MFDSFYQTDSIPKQPRLNAWSLQQILMRLLMRSLLAGAISAIGLLTGWVPMVYSSSSDSFALERDYTASAQAVNVSNEEVQRYARSVRAIEPIRQAAYDAIKRILGSRQVPSVACHRPNSLNNLNQNIRQIAVNYCNRAIQIVEQNNLTINRFNTITVASQSDSELAARIQEEIGRQQQNP